MKTRLALALAAALLLAGAAQARTFSGRVTAVTDGDTVTVRADGQPPTRIRLHGVDAPEKRQPFGHAAKRAASDLAYGRVVTVVERNRDRYGRTVGEVLLPDGRSLGRELVRAGLAWHYVRYAPGDDELSRLEAQARASRRLLWSDPDPVAPWEFRKSRRRGGGER